MGKVLSGFASCIRSYHFVIAMLRAKEAEFGIMKTNILSLVLIPLFAYSLCSPRAQAVTPAPDGCYPGFTTAEGCNALQSLTTGAGNTGLGWRSLFLNTTGNFNTALGAGALVLNNGDSNTATGAAALLLNTTGTDNTANGTDALVYNDTGSFNTAVGAFALTNNTASGNTAVGSNALLSNTTGGTLGTVIGFDVGPNVAVGEQALENNTLASANTAVGYQALHSFTAGPMGFEGLGLCTAVGFQALANTTGTTGVTSNTAIGYKAGYNLTNGDGNVCIGANVLGVAGESFTTRIKNVYDSVATTRQVYVNSDNKIGTLSSSRRYKQQIKRMEQASETLFALNPVTFRYNKEVDPSQALSFGLIAEEVAKINPELITRDEEGRPQTVRYEAVNAMLLNEFLKEHRTVQDLKSAAAKQEATIARQQKQIEALTAGLQKVSAQLEVSKPATQTVLNNQ
jgi:hypothetical protein